MHDIVSKALAEALGIIRFRWQGLLTAWLVCVLGWVGITLIPNSYESKAVLYIDTATVLRPLLADLAVNTDVMSEVLMMTEVLMSRPQLERVVRETDLHLRAKTREEFEELLASVRQQIQVMGGAPMNSYSEQNLFTIRFVDKDPVVVHAVVRSLLDAFVGRSLGQNRADTADAQQFIEEQIFDYEDRLAEAEKRLADFKKKNVGLMPSEGRDYYQRLQVALDDLSQSQSEYNKIKRRRDALQDQIDGEEPTFGLLASPDSSIGSPAEGDAEIEALEEEMATLLSRYTEKHPRVVELSNRIQQLQRQRDQFAGLAAQQPAFTLDTDLVNMNSLDLNPVYQNLKIAIGEANAELSGVESQITDAKARVEYLREMVDTIPEVEAELSRLNRDYEVNRTQHTALLRRLESARLSEDAEFRNDEVKFRVIEPPYVPLKPIGPNRYLFATVVLIAGMGIGLSFSYLLSLINPVYTSIDGIREDLHLPVLGALSVFESVDERQQSRRGNRRFVMGAGGLIAMYFVVLAIWPMSDVLKNVLMNSGVLL